MVGHGPSFLVDVLSNDPETLSTEHLTRGQPATLVYIVSHNTVAAAGRYPVLALANNTHKTGFTQGPVVGS